MKGADFTRTVVVQNDSEKEKEKGVSDMCRPFGITLPTMNPPNETKLIPQIKVQSVPDKKQTALFIPAYQIYPCLRSDQLHTSVTVVAVGGGGGSMAADNK